jgi:hypothetical protein
MSPLNSENANKINREDRNQVKNNFSKINETELELGRIKRETITKGMIIIIGKKTSFFNQLIS